jgi:hypothetical protein
MAKAMAKIIVAASIEKAAAKINENEAASMSRQRHQQ